MATSKVRCFRCGKHFQKDNREINRSVRRGQRHFCTASCAAQVHADASRAKEVSLTCPCGKRFVTTTKVKAAKHCSRACASRYSMNEERREAQRQGGLQAVGNLISQADALRRREAWKYAALREALGARPHQFEYGLGGYVFDLVLLDTRMLVEFDGPYHKDKQQRLRDDQKKKIAEHYGFVLVRRPVIPASIVDPSTIEGL